MYEKKWTLYKIRHWRKVIYKHHDDLETYFYCVKNHSLLEIMMMEGVVPVRKVRDRPSPRWTKNIEDIFVMRFNQESFG